MTKKEKNQLLIVGVIVIVLYLLSRKGSGKTIEIESDFVLGAYADFVNSSSNITYEGMPLYIWLARNTQDYETVKAQYQSTYGVNLTYALIDRLGDNLPAFVAELWANNEQALS